MLKGIHLGARGLELQLLRSLGRFTLHTGVLETYLDDMKGMKAQVYDLFRQHPDLLPNVEEGLSKGAFECERLTCPAVGLCLTPRTG